MWLDKKPTYVRATAESVKKDYEILQENLPIQIGIDHLDDDILAKNKILQKMNLLDVGIITAVKLENDSIKIAEAKITNPTIQALYDAGELDDFSIVSDMYVRPCPTGKADAIEDYSVINRVDFVGKGACKTCQVEPPAAMASSGRFNAKAIIGDENMAGDNPANDGAGDGKEDVEPTMADIGKTLAAIATTLEKQNKALAAIEGKMGIKEPVDDNNAQPPAGDKPPAGAAGSADDDDKKEMLTLLSPSFQMI